MSSMKPATTSTTGSSASKKPKDRKTKKVKVVEEVREKSWYIPPSGGIPIYKADQDPNCPVARIKRFNDDQKLRVKEAMKQDKRSENWIKATLDTKYQDVPLRVNIGLRTKAIEVATKGNNSNKAALADVEILQKIIVRERLLSELSRLLKTGSDVGAVLGEATELIKALRYETLEIIEDIHIWQTAQATVRPFLFKGMNYLIKIARDLDFLDSYDDVMERFCFEFKCNPLAYRGGGNVITGRESNNTENYLKGLLKSYYDSGLTNVDGIDVVRLHNAEKMVQNEFNRIAKNARNNPQQDNSFADFETTGDNGRMLSIDSLPSISNGGETPNGFPQPEQAGFSSSHHHRTHSGKKKKAVINPKKTKLERIAVLKEEAGELEAMISHIQEKIQSLVEHHRSLEAKKKNIEQKLAEAKAHHKEATAQHLAAEGFLVTSEITENGVKIKDLQRESYFITLERKRKVGVVNKLKEELNEEARRQALKKQIENKIKKEGLMAALSALNIEGGSMEGISMQKTGKGIKKAGPKKKNKIKDVKISFNNEPSSSSSQQQQQSDYEDMVELYKKELAQSQSSATIQSGVGTSSVDYSRNGGEDDEEDEEDGDEEEEDDEEGGEEEDEDGEEEEEDGEEEEGDEEEEEEEGDQQQQQVHAANNNIEQPPVSSSSSHLHQFQPSDDASHHSHRSQHHNSGTNNINTQQNPHNSGGNNDHYISDDDGEEEEDGEEDDEEGDEEDGEEEDDDEHDDMQLSPLRHMYDHNHEDSSFVDAMRSPGDMSTLEVSGDGSLVPHFPVNGRSMSGSRFDDDHSEIFAAFRPEDSQHEDSQQDVKHVAGAGFAVAKALKDSRAEDS